VREETLATHELSPLFVRQHDGLDDEVMLEPNLRADLDRADAFGRRGPRDDHEHVDIRVFASFAASPRPEENDTVPFTDKISLTMRAGYPAFSVGVSFFL
jgi:hypothetical protein